jgi:hypothetical protein
MVRHRPPGVILRRRLREPDVAGVTGKLHVYGDLLVRAAENNSMMQRDDEELLDLAANRVRSLSQVTN